MKKIKKEDFKDIIDKIIVGFALKKDMHIDIVDKGYQLTVGNNLLILNETSDKTVDEQTIYEWELTN